MPARDHARASTGRAGSGSSRSGTLSYGQPPNDRTRARGVDLGRHRGDPVNGSSFRDHLGHFEHDSGTTSSS
ncbi:hypothetical protein HBB16_09150 [Pseudonocardia sp. MCCB 268]|nr:hypothetical protein [Pseudonocardia cytotoxica]